MKGLAVVTGASSGIGRAFAIELARRGHPVLAVARRAELLETLAAESRPASSAPIHTLTCDLALTADIERVAQRARELGGASWLVNNAGSTVFGAFADRELDGQLALVRLNCQALVALTGHLLPVMRERGKGTVLNVASVAGFMPTPYMGVYGATKAFVISFSESLRAELSGSGINVTVLCPGPVATEIYQVGAPGAARTPPRHEISAEQCATFGISAAERGVAIAIPGLQNRLNVWASKFAPRALLRTMLRRGGLAYLGYTRKALKLP